MKICPKFAQILPFLAAVGLCALFAAAPRPVAAAAPFSDDFDDYNTYQYLGDQNPLWNSASGEITDTISDTSPNSFVGAHGDRTGDLIQYGTWYFSLYVQDGISDSGVHIISFIGATGGGASAVQLRLHDDGTTWTLRVPKTAYPYTKDLITGLEFNRWYRISFDWAAGGYSICVDYDCEVNWNLVAPVWNGVVGTGYQKLAISNFKSGANSYIDTIDDEFEPTPPTIPGNWPIISGTDPADGQTSIVDYSDIDLIGDIQIPSASPYTWTDITAKFTESGGLGVFYQEIPFVQELVAGDEYTYIATTTIEADPTKLYSVSYYMHGYTDNPPVSVTYPYLPADTYITETGTTPAGGIPLVNVDEWEPPALENCDLEEYNFLEKMTCKIQNSLLGLVIPSKESVTALFGTLGAFQNKFPFSYVSALIGTLQGIIAGVNESGAITLTLFGHSGAVDLSFWQNPVTVNGFETSLGGVIKTAFLAAILVVFLLWGLNYLHRIL